LLIRLIDAFLAESPELFQGVRRGLEVKNFDGVRMSAHTLKSCGNNLGAVRLSAVCQDMESAALAKDLQEMERLVGKLGPEFFEAEQALRGERAREQGLLPETAGV